MKVFDDVQFASLFFEKIENRFHSGDYWPSSFFPIRFKNPAQSKQFRDNFKDLDDTQKQQWFQHNYYQACRLAFDQDQLRDAREIVILILKIHSMFKLQLQRPYQFWNLIEVCWMKCGIKNKEVSSALKEIYDDCQYPAIEPQKKRKNNTQSCGCFKTSSEESRCNIF